MDSDQQKNLRGCLICLLIVAAVGGWIAYKGIPTWPWEKEKPTPTPPPGAASPTPDAAAGKQIQWFDIQNDFRHLSSLSSELYSRCKYSGDIQGDPMQSTGWALWSSSFQMSLKTYAGELKSRYEGMNNSSESLRMAANNLMGIANALPGLVSLCENVLRKQTPSSNWQFQYEKSVINSLNQVRKLASDNNVTL